MPSDYLFCLTRPGSEPLLKQEVSAFHPNLRFAFSRPGIVTFKSSRPLTTPADVPYFRFARRRGLTLGRGSLDEVFELYRSFRERVIGRPASAVQVSSRSFPVWIERGISDLPPRPRSDDDEPLLLEGDDYAAYALEASTLQTRLLECGVSLATSPLEKLGIDETALATSTAGSPPPGTEIIEFIQTDAGKWILGFSQPGELEFTSPGGLSNFHSPVGAPSRAYLKLEEALRFYEVRVEPKDEVLDLGCAPGGMSYSWLERGARVVGVDRGAMAESIAKNPRFRALDMNLSQVVPDDLPTTTDWVSLDVNAQPSVALREAVPLFADQEILGFFMNLKMNRTGIIKDLPLLERQICEELHLVRYCVKQLPSNRDEVAFFGVTERGLTRAKFSTPESPLMSRKFSSRRSR